MALASLEDRIVLRPFHQQALAEAFQYSTLVYSKSLPRSRGLSTIENNLLKNYPCLLLTDPPTHLREMNAKRPTYKT